MNERILNERYVLESEIGRGGMGIVYKAKDTQLSRTVAIKVLPAEFGHDKQFVERFRREVLNSAKLDHPNIVHVHDVGNDGGTYYYVMQFIEGSDLHSEIKNTGGMPIGECARIINQVAQALDYAHQRGIVHRDIKPENILLDDQKNAHVVDFGIARSVEGTRLTGGMIGTPAYMSPEQGRGEEVDGRSDQYALAIVAYEMLTGVTPFRSDMTQPWALVNMHISMSPPDPRQFRADIPEHICLALMRALSKVPSERYSSCDEFSNTLLEVSTPYTHRSSRDEVSRPRAETQATLKVSANTIPRSSTPKLRVYAATALVVLLVGVGLLLMPRGSKPPAGSVEPPSGGNATAVAPPTQPPPITRTEVQVALDRWVAAQNNRNIEEYKTLYSSDFKGIKRTRNGKSASFGYTKWLLDRGKMLTNTSDLQVSITNVSITNLSSNSAKAEFTQYFRTSKYGDYGPKEMRFRKSGNEIKVTYEEMKWSKPLQ